MACCSRICVMRPVLLHAYVAAVAVSGKRELMPEALDMCDNFKSLRELVLMSPLEDSPVVSAQ